MNDTTPATEIDETQGTEGKDTSRRSMLRGVALGIASAGAATLLTNGRPAHAADGGAVTMGQTNEFNTATNVNYKGATTAASFNVQSGDETTGNNTILNNNFNSVGTALLGVATYRRAQYFFPILLGGVLYGSLRVGPWSIKRRDRLRRLRDIAAEASTERAFDFSVRFAQRPKHAVGNTVADSTAPLPIPDSDADDDVG